MRKVYLWRTNEVNKFFVDYGLEQLAEKEFKRTSKYWNTFYIVKYFVVAFVNLIPKKIMFAMLFWNVY